jgi:hypothetical protein
MHEQLSAKNKPVSTDSSGARNARLPKSEQLKKQKHGYDCTV